MFISETVPLTLFLVKLSRIGRVLFGSLTGVPAVFLWERGGRHHQALQLRPTQQRLCWPSQR
jgi:hypothetical protein